MSQRKSSLRIANAGGYWGDDPGALYRQITGGPLDYVTMDFLAEITMSILQKQRSRDPKLGYAKDFIPMVESVLPLLLKNKTRIITNAGGVHPEACAAAIAEVGKRLGLRPKIAVVYGDDILARLPQLTAKGARFDNMETGAPFTEVAARIEAANVYFGAAPIVEALQWEPDIIITGRVTDTGITLAPMIHEFGWALNDWDKLAAGIVAGHIIECGSQSTGGNFTDWHLVPSFHNIGYPIVEVSPDASFVVTKHSSTGGLVSVDTVREQLFYEMGNPHAYITPDVIADFTSIRVAADGENRVKVTGIKGQEPTDSYKVSMAYADGFKSVGSIIISGPDARAKAEAFAGIFWERCGRDFLETDTEYVGWNACHRSLGHAADGNEILLRLGARAQDEARLRAFGKLIPSLILSGPPGVAVIGGVPKAQEVVSYWPALLAKSAICPRIAYFDQGLKDEREVTSTPTGHFNAKGKAPQLQVAEQATGDIASTLGDSADVEARALVEICLGRSGDKGDTANIGILARSPEAFHFLDGYLTAQRVKNLFQELCHGKVERYTLPNLLGFNFLLEGALGGGGTMTLRLDAQGKTFAQALIRQKTRIPQSVLAQGRDAKVR